MKTQTNRNGGRSASNAPDERPATTRPPKSTETVDRAIHDIRYIRDLIDMSRDFFVSGWSGVAAGFVLVLGAVATAWIIESRVATSLPAVLWLLWIVIAAALVGIDVFFFARRSREEGRPVFSTILLKGILIETIIGVEGLILTFVFIRLGTPELIAGAWLLTFGTIMTALGMFVPGGAWIMGLACLAASVTAFVAPGLSLYCLGIAGTVMILWGVGYLIIRGK